MTDPDAPTLFPTDPEPSWVPPPRWSVWGGATPERCRSCAAPVLWMRHENRSWAPFNPSVEGQPSVSHFATCPQAATWRRQQRAMPEHDEA